MHELTLYTCGCALSVRTHDDETTSLVRAAFGGLSGGPDTGSAAVRSYEVEAGQAGYRVFDGTTVSELDDADSLLFHIDKDITLLLQHERRDLFFVHAAAVARASRAVVLAAPSSTGKSTLVLSLIERGLDYLSDELAPVDLRTRAVEPYPHALCLKSLPPAPYRLPPNTLRCGRRYHVPVDGPSLAAQLRTLAALIFLRRDDDRFHGLRPISAASASARLMANALNPLAHPGDGLDAAVALSQAVPCLEIDIWDLADASHVIEAFLA